MNLLSDGPGAAKLLKTTFTIFFISLLTTVGLSACVSTSAPKVSALPQWVTSPPSDQGGVLNGIGSSYDLESAKVSALKDVTGKLGITVSGQYEQRQQLAGTHYSQYVDDRTMLDIQDTPISDYQLRKSEVIDGQVYVWLSVAKSSIIKGLREKLDLSHTQAKKTSDSMAKQARLIWYLAAKTQLKQHFSDAVRYASMLSLLEPQTSFDGQIQPWKQLSDQVSQAGVHICMAITAKGQSQDIVSILHHHLSQQNITIAADCDNKLMVDTSSNQYKISQNYVTQLTTRLGLNIDNQGRFGSNTVITSGQSVLNYSGSAKAAASQFESKVQNSDIWQLIGIKNGVQQ